MGNMTLSIPDELHKEMKEFSEVRWSEVARKAFAEKVETFRKIEQIAQKSKFTQKDADEIGALVRKGMHEHFLRHSR